MTKQGFYKRQKSNSIDQIDHGDGIHDSTESTTPPVPARPIRQPLFEYPELPRLEILIYFIVLCSTLVYAWYKVYLASSNYDWDQRTGWGRFEIGQWPFPIWGSPFYRKDTSNYEWRVWPPFAYQTLPWFLGHAILFNLDCIIVMPQQLWWWTLFLYWSIAHIWVAGGMIMFISVVQGISVFIVAWLTGSKMLTWSAGVYLLYANVHNPFLFTSDPVGDGGVEMYVAISTLSYKMLQYLSFVTEMISQKSKRPAGFYAPKYRIFSMFWYALYLPYSYYMIIIYKKFPQQLIDRSITRRSMKEIMIFGTRILFWYLLFEMALRFFYCESLISDPDFLSQTTKDTLVSIGYGVGQFFHLKYVIIFGLSGFFAKFDNMKPNDGPICITRLALYSRLWRCFDRGLYDFFKEYIFLPICRPTFSLCRKLLGLFVSYAFVLVWHGTTHKYVVWILLNITEILIESIAKGVYSIPAVKWWREKRISDRNFRRTLAWLQIIPFAFGLYSNFYFLGSSQSGYVFVDRIFWQETVALKYPFFILIGIGYCYCHVCMEVDRWQSGKRQREEDKRD